MAQHTAVPGRDNGDHPESVSEWPPRCASATMRLRVRAPSAWPDSARNYQQRGSPLGQDAPNMDGRPHPVGTQARPPGGSPACRPAASAQRREDARRQGPPGLHPARRRDRSDRCPDRGAERPRSRGQGRCHPPERGRAPQVAADPPRQRGDRWRPAGDRGPRREGHSKAQAAKAAKARISASKAVKAKGAQTAAGKARAALTKTTRTEAATTAAPAETPKPAAKAKATTTKAKATTGSAKTAAKKPAAKKTASKS